MGLCAGLLNFGINEIETFAFGHNDEEFHIITEQTTALRRFLSVLAAGAIVTLIRILLIRLKPFLNVASMMDGRNPPFWQNLIHSVLQLVAIALGAPVGSEAAPRELGGLFAAKICRALNIGEDELRLSAPRSGLFPLGGGIRRHRFEESLPPLDGDLRNAGGARRCGAGPRHGGADRSVRLTGGLWLPGDHGGPDRRDESDRMHLLGTFLRGHEVRRE